MIFSEIHSWILGGGALALLAAIVDGCSMRSKVKQARAEAERAKAEAEALQITNTENATRILMENIVKPLKEELNVTRNEMRAIKREMERLRKAIEAATDCPHSRDCPVMRRLRVIQKGDPEHGSDLPLGVSGLGGNRNKADP